MLRGMGWSRDYLWLRTRRANRITRDNSHASSRWNHANRKRTMSIVWVTMAAAKGKSEQLSPCKAKMCLMTSAHTCDRACAHMELNRWRKRERRSEGVSERKSIAWVSERESLVASFLSFAIFRFHYYWRHFQREMNFPLHRKSITKATVIAVLIICLITMYFKKVNN